MGTGCPNFQLVIHTDRFWVFQRGRRYTFHASENMLFSQRLLCGNVNPTQVCRLHALCSLHTSCMFGITLLLCSEYKSKHVTKTDLNCVVIFMDAWTVVTVVIQKLCFFHTFMPTSQVLACPPKKKKKTHWKCNKNNLTSILRLKFNLI